MSVVDYPAVAGSAGIEPPAARASLWFVVGRIVLAALALYIVLVVVMLLGVAPKTFERPEPLQETLTVDSVEVRAGASNFRVTGRTQPYTPLVLGALSREMQAGFSDQGAMRLTLRSRISRPRSGWKADHGREPARNAKGLS